MTSGISTRMSRRSVLLHGLALSTADLAALSAFGQERAETATASGRVPRYVGVNLAGAGFGRLPGVHGREYLYPTRLNVDYYADLGFNLIRLPFKWERLQPELGQPFSASEQSLLTDIVGYASARGMHVILDPHNYAKRRIRDDGWSKEYVIGSAQVPEASFVEFWLRLAGLFRGDPRVLFGLMNEPVSISASDWLKVVNHAIAAIRADGASNLVLVPGVAYSGAHSWHSSGNLAMAAVVDPADAFAFDVHQYFDADSSGTHPEAVSGTIGSERVEAFQEWARAHRFKAILGEFNGGRNQAGYNALADLCEEMAANPDVWLGWAAWAGGPRWPEADMYNLEPWSDGRQREQTRILAAFAQPRSPTAWAAPGATIDLDLAHNRLVGVDALTSVLAVERASEGYADRRNGSQARFEPNLPRQTDKGLLIEEERENLLRSPFAFGPNGWSATGLMQEDVMSAPDGAGRATTLREIPGHGWCTVSQGVTLPGRGTHALSVFARHAGRQWLSLRGDRPSSIYGSFDLERGRVGRTSAQASSMAGLRGGWQRPALVWTPAGPGAATILFALRDAEGDPRPYTRGAEAVHLWGPVLEEGPFATSYVPNARAREVIRMKGPLLAALQRPSFTLVVETRELPAAAAPCEILSAGGLALLRRGPDGALATSLGGGHQTAPQPLRSWRMRRRAALALDRRAGRVSLGVTGVEAVTFEAAVPAIENLILGGSDTGALNGFICRLTIFSEAMQPGALEARLA